MVTFSLRRTTGPLIRLMQYSMYLLGREGSINNNEILQADQDDIVIRDGSVGNLESTDADMMSDSLEHREIQDPDDLSEGLSDVQTMGDRSGLQDSTQGVHLPTGGEWLVNLWAGVVGEITTRCVKVSDPSEGSTTGAVSVATLVAQSESMHSGCKVQNYPKSVEYGILHAHCAHEHTVESAHDASNVDAPYGWMESKLVSGSRSVVQRWFRLVLWIIVFGILAEPAKAEERKDPVVAPTRVSASSTTLSDGALTELCEAQGQKWLPDTVAADPISLWDRIKKSLPGWLPGKKEFFTRHLHQ